MPFEVLEVLCDCGKLKTVVSVGESEDYSLALAIAEAQAGTHEQSFYDPNFGSWWILLSQGFSYEIRIHERAS
jgi:hypothetical protein